MRNTTLSVSLLSLLVAACGSRSTQTDAGDPSLDAGITYWQDVAPIINAKCVGCHQTGGIAPMALDSFEAVKANAALIGVVTRAGTMPPFLLTHDGSCGSVEDGETLSAAQIDRLGEWADSKHDEGVKVTLTTPPVRSLGEATAYQTPMITPIAQGGTLAEEDEYRCYEFDSALPADRFITGYEVLAGNPAMVHHLLAFVVDPTHVTSSGKTNAEVIKALDDADPTRAGWQCFGLAGKGVDVESVPVDWAPGQGPVVYPGSIGAAFRKTDKLVVQVHYNLADPRVRGQTDTSTLRVRTAASVERKAIFVLWDPLLDTAFTANPTMIPPAAAATTLKYTTTLAAFGLGGVPHVDLVGILPHMHARGRTIQLDVTNAGAAKVCASKVDRWTINWQKFYTYKEPLRLTGASQLEQTCVYDTSAQTQPTSPGWGTRNEMCLSVLMLALPAGL